MGVNKESCELNEQREQSYACMKVEELDEVNFAEREQVRAQLNQRIKESKIQRFKDSKKIPLRVSRRRGGKGINPYLPLN